MEPFTFLLASAFFATSAHAALPAAEVVATTATVVATSAARKVETLPSGVRVQHTLKGAGAHPTASDTVKVHYRGTLPDGSEFDSSHRRGKPIALPLSRVVKCWTDGVQTMQVGGKATLTCPSDTAYGQRGVPGSIPPNSVLKFDIELLSIGSDQ
ncbi:MULTISPECIES: FKBP-type peptidyl-prolyl cis-trans isomerase [unclassified Variovorax]|uniref:FKBP-type peptidyl-prolyl cis-trans isomerase n=1 Tax=unclassified Variovorax TaxID=663243 RepID=UPI001315F1A6|nr:MULTISPECIES: FKBP-type peptidyl-prolyl cis-trans isomerase [unclassified Variovorax]VTU42069.1 putative FKBP-type peptidyl-prolyl cis-trans isomerase FkpA precursor [Variovorax sp. SRS16]VTU42104.1 putative FKBP-type peptidyl-prolyl cis-trans isomerase FkpA precursor [Variovorax sp. PBL-E5]VTU44388.1 putative FKBP-type peptidyl-prolyl cis-trans isomerase FkpA precursor [Variovorax sp. PBL-H6]